MWWLLLVLFLGALQPSAASPLLLEPGFSRVGVYPYLLTAVDTSGRLTAAQIQAGALNFTLQEKEVPSWGFRPDAIWGKLKIVPQKSKEKLLLEIDMPLLDRVSLWLWQGDSLLSETHTGYIKDFKQRPVKHRNFVFELPAITDTITAYVRIQSVDRLEMPISIWEEAAFYQNDQKDQFYGGIFLGLISGSILLLALMFVAFKDLAYLFYSFFMFFFVFFVAGQMGYVHEYIWPSFLTGYNHYMHLCILMILISQVLLNMHFLETKQHHPRAHRGLTGIFYYLMFLLGLTFFVPINVAYMLAVGSVIVVMGGVFIVSLIACTRSRAAAMFMLAWGVSILVAILYALKSFGVIPPHLVPPQMMWAAWVVQFVVISMGLGERLTNARRKKEALQMESIENLKLANVEKDEFLANTSHELRTPLHGIIGIAESLLDGAAGVISSKAAENLGMIVASSRRLANLVNDILDVSQYNNKELIIKQNAVDVAQIAKLVAGIHKPLAEGKGNKIRLELKKGLPFVLGDEDRIQQVINNILSNAIRYTTNGMITISAFVVGDEVEVSIKDTGIGISIEEQQKLFADEDAENPQHAAMGLSLCKIIVDLHGGKISIRSEVGKGTRLNFSLPIAREQHNAVATSTATVSKLQLIESLLDESLNLDVVESNKGHILVVDDEYVNVNFLENQLTTQNFKVSAAYSGKQALEFLEHNPKPDLILLDVMMPEISGYKVCRIIREKWDLSVLPVIMLTSNSQVVDLVEGLDSGANDYLTKPFTNHELLARVNTHLSLARTNNNYARFVPQQFLQQLNRKSILDVELGDHVKQDMAIVFCYVKNFANLSQTMSVEDNFNFLNSYLLRITPIIEDYNGIVDKYTGKGIMALFPKDAVNAAKASLAVLSEAEIYNVHRANSDYDPIDLSIGIHYGSLMLGTIGEQSRMDVTVIADSVNVAARVEEMNMAHHTNILITDVVYQMLPENMQANCTSLGMQHIRGRVQKVEVFNLKRNQRKSRVVQK